ncbi:MAG: hypothetical protein Q7J85_10435 [Bacillota bacterium]|nr:hypothetical protein [Bacillota bacterium]
MPCLLDDTDLPPLISDRSSVDLNDVGKGIEELLDNLTGQRTQRARLLAIQSALDDMDLEWITHPALPPMVCCPNCGGDKENLLPWQEIDEVRDDIYYGMRCKRCGWSNGGEI